MKNYSQILLYVTTTPWMMHPPALKLMLDILDAHLSGNMSAEEVKARMAVVDKKPPLEPKRNGTVGVLNLEGPIFPKANLFTEFSGGVSLDQFQQEFRTMLADESVGSIVLNIDSPGGSAQMIPEVMAEIRAARDVKPIYAVANTMAASAAYGLASSASEFYASPSAIVGSVGTYLVHESDSKLMEKIGIEQSVIKAGRFKAVELESLTPEARAYLQDYVNEVDHTFLSEIAQGRGTTVEDVSQNYGEGGVVTPSFAKSRGMIDGIATFDRVLVEASNGGGVSLQHRSSPGPQSSYDADKEHSEPGTGLGGEPQPREAPEEGDPAIEGGWRRDSPPIAFDPDTEEAVNREWLEQRASALGVEFSAETSDEDLAIAVASAMDAVVVPLANATADAERQRRFESDYPEQARQLAELAQRDQESAARSFADSYMTFEGQNKGFSTLVRQSIEQAHRKIATRQFSETDLKELLDLVSAKEATVERGENGSARTPEDESYQPTRDFVADRKQFTDLVRQAMTDDGLSREAALKHVADQHPELAQAYLTGHVR